MYNLHIDKISFINIMNFIINVKRYINGENGVER